MSRLGLACVVGLLAVPQTVRAGVIEFTDRPSWEAAVGAFTTIDFTDFPHGTIITTQYSGLGATFTDGNDTIFVYPDAFPIDGVGLDAQGSITISFSTPMSYIGVDFPGSLHIDLFSGGSPIYSSSNFGGIGAGFFAGLVTQSTFDEVLLTDWFDGLAAIDNLSFGIIPAPGTLALLGLAGLMSTRRRRR